VVKYIKHKYTKMVENELEILTRFRNQSDYVLQMSGYYVLDNKDVIILSNYIKKTIDLNDFILYQDLSNKDYIPIIHELLKGLSVIHSLDVVHMDVKPKNILIYPVQKKPDPPIYKIIYIDFGFACHKDNTESIKKYKGTPQYMDSRMIERKILSFEEAVKADIWSLGITIYKLIHKKLPWLQIDKDKIKLEICSTRRVSSVNPYFATIIENILHKNPRKRYSLSALLEITKNWQHTDENH